MASCWQDAPSYLDYLTERAAKTHDVRTPEGKVAAANAILPYLIKVPNPILRAELARRLAERLRVDERLLRDELRRAAGEKRAEVHVRKQAAPDANHGVKQLLRACLESDEMADAVLPEIVESGAVDGLFGENIFKQLWEARQRNEKLNLAETEGLLSPRGETPGIRRALLAGCCPDSGTGPGLPAGAQTRAPTARA